ncbi:MAG TPA: hypothetical protein VJL56_00925, partial [Candidatus Bathyarchaeia archaeon]|nr:hypothetical protein [Candidatus Bathyarchaeia archaeon]
LLPQYGQKLLDASSSFWQPGHFIQYPETPLTRIGVLSSHPVVVSSARKSGTLHHVLDEAQEAFFVNTYTDELWLDS